MMAFMKSRINALSLAALAALLCCVSARAEDVRAWESGSEPGPVRHYVLGAALSSSRAHLGQGDRSLGLQPVVGFWFGRYRLASGSAGELLSIGRETVDAGLSTTLARNSAWALGAALSWDPGRQVDDDPLLRGVPELESTLRGKLSLSYALGPRWSLGLSGNQDLLGREGGGQLGIGLGYRHPVSPRTYWDASISARWAGSTYMQSHYGLSSAAAAAAGRTVYEPGASWEGLQLGWGLRSAINHHWVWFGGLGFSQLQGAARSSPLVGERNVWSANIGLAYRR
jgi:outer membrane scaffolding protein for murein synthesis (MipA/OmpV family)